ncbi:UNVERIFIED_CONTAM: hypothetical protein PYX00_004861 [Menopon gallinae]|uniref:AP-3 complex subunit delta n=1 Tax=Menopon gallinae TaxID=328185 RepID=A0AAW2I619_9NEOP
MALKKVKGNLERMFDKNLNDLVRGIRNNKDNEGKYIAQCIEEIKLELRQDNVSVKANAVAKLIYLQMLGYDISWAGFNIIEVMSSNKLTFKRIGYLAASQSFHSDSELLMLTTNMIRKDLNSQSQYDAGLALSGLSCFVSTDLAKDLANDIMTLLSSTKPYIRKKAVLMMYKIFLRFPDALRPAFPRLKEKLDDPDSGVQSACVNVVCELARKNPRNYLSLAPVFFKLMTSSTNNWMLIKIIKLFGALTPLEPRLGKKLIEPLTNLIHSTSAMSLLYECINTVLAVLISISSGMPTHSASIQLCVQKLRILIEDSDQNLKYLGLLAMSKILTTHPKSVQAHKDLVLQCLDDKDESIRLRALDLLYGMVSKKNLMEIVKKLMVHMNKAEGTSYRDQLLSKIIQICSQNNYQHITNFEWYVSVLVDVTRMEGTQRGPLIADQMMDVALRVKAIRGFCVEQMSLLLENAHLIAGSGCASSNMSQVLYAAAWICGEFASELTNPRVTLEAMLTGKGVTNLPGHIQAVYIHNILKLFVLILVRSAEENMQEVMEVSQFICDRLPQFVSSGDLEVQERASSALHLMKYICKNLEKDSAALISELTMLFTGELNPVAPKAQKKVQIPEGLDLDAWINEPLSSESSSEDEEKPELLFSKSEFANDYKPKSKEPELTEEELAKRRMARKMEQANNLYYLKSDEKERETNLKDIPIHNIDLQVPLKIPGLASSDKYLEVKKGGKERKVSKKKKSTKKSSKKAEKSSSEDENAAPLVIVNTDIGEMPEGASLSDVENEVEDMSNDPHRALNINLDEPLREEERLPIPSHRPLPEPVKEPKKKSSKENKLTKVKTKSKKKKETKKDDSIDLWLEDEPKESKDLSALPSNDYEDMTKKTKKKVKKEKKTKTKKRKEEGLLLKEDDIIDVISTLNIDNNNSVTDNNHINNLNNKNNNNNNLVNGEFPVEVSSTNNLLSLAEDKVLKMLYNLRILSEGSNEILASLVLINRTSDSLVKDLNLNISDSGQVELARNDSFDRYEDIKLDFQLGSQQRQEVEFVFRVSDCTVPHKLRGTLAYKVQDSDGIATQDKIDFWIRFPVSTLFSNYTASQSEYSSLLAGGSLLSKQSFLIENKSFNEVLERLSEKCKLKLIEKVEETASLFSRTLLGQNVCVLLKSNGGGVAFDAKSDSDSLLRSLVDEVKTAVS